MAQEDMKRVSNPSKFGNPKIAGNYSCGQY
jgi:hypothetical protein